MLEKDQKYYRIGQVSKILGVEPHVLRFWESQFKQIKPKRISKHRLYRNQDLKILKRIKELLYNEGYTIAGAKKKLKEEQIKNMAKLAKPNNSLQKIDILEEIKKELLEIKLILSNNSNNKN